MASDPLSIYVAIPARNAGWCIDRCLAGLFSAGFSASEICLVDDGSSDDTLTKGQAAGIKTLSLPTSQGAAAARNFAVAATDADILFFVDADVVIHADVRDRLLVFFERNQNVDAVFGAYDDAPSSPGAASQYRNLLHHYVHTHGPSRVQTFWTGCGAVRRSAFESVGGFCGTQRMMEDVEFGLRLSHAGGIIALDGDIQGTHLKQWSVIGMAKTDLLDRAIPWTRLILAGNGFSADLNLGVSHRLSAAMTGVVWLGLFAAPIWLTMLWLSAAAIIGFVAINAKFFKFVGQKVGLRVAATSVPLHLLHYSCAIAGLSWVFLMEALPRRLKPFVGSIDSARHLL